MKIEMRDKWTGWVLVRYVASSIRHAKERLRQALAREESKRDKFLEDQKEVRRRAERLAVKCREAGDTTSPEVRRAINELKDISRREIEWDEHAIEYRVRQKQEKAEARQLRHKNRE